MVHFIPDRIQPTEAQLPYFEDSSREKGIAGQGTDKSLQELQAEIRTAVARLGGGVTRFIPGTYPGSPRRYGYRIEFLVGNVRGRIDVAALPIRKETDVVRTKALKQALYMCRDILASQYYATLLMPGSVPLLPYLVGPGDKTVAEAMMESGQLPALETGPAVEIVTGEVIE